MVAVVQLAIALGATAGGFVYDLSGYRSTFALSAAALCVSALVAAVAWRQSRKQSIVKTIPVLHNAFAEQER
jgi:predicted MFS family arabinose efflux permease